MGERTGSRVFQWVWSYVMIDGVEDGYNRATIDTSTSKGPSLLEFVPQGVISVARMKAM
ncbi:hypothetical protein LX36DRAFT_661187 [Colletotrichum falcatum]|nr:hypothetical protein LX36DRAFT_661187 [Colletotrichum falcatum]